MPTTGLRERKKARTREAIMAAAFDLFDRHGFAATTVGQIADAAQVSPRTFFRYFPAKDDVVFDGFDDALGLWADALRSAPAGTSLGEAMRRATLAVVHLMTAEDAARRLALIGAEPPLVRRMAEFDRHAQRRSAEVIAERLGVDAETDPGPRVIAAAAMAAVWTTTGMARAGQPERIAAVDRAFALIRDLDKLLDTPLPARIPQRGADLRAPEESG